MVDEAVESRKAGAAEGQVVYPSIIRSIQDPSAQALLRSDNLVDRQKINVLGDWDCSIGFFACLQSCQHPVGTSQASRTPVAWMQIRILKSPAPRVRVPCPRLYDAAH